MLRPIDLILGEARTEQLCVSNTHLKEKKAYFDTHQVLPVEGAFWQVWKPSYSSSNHCPLCRSYAETQSSTIKTNIRVVTMNGKQLDLHYDFQALHPPTTFYCSRFARLSPFHTPSRL